MREPYGEGLATHTDPESCAGGREGVGEALIGAHAGWVLSRERYATGAPTLWGESGPSRRGRGVSRSNGQGNTGGRAMASARTAPRGGRPFASPGARPGTRPGALR